MNLASTYLLPFGPGRRYVNSKGVAGHIIGGWEIGGIAVMQSGLPFTVKWRAPRRTPAPEAAPIQSLERIPILRTKASISGLIQPRLRHLPRSLGALSEETLLNALRFITSISRSERSFDSRETAELQFRSEFFNGLQSPTVRSAEFHDWRWRSRNNHEHAEIEPSNAICLAARFLTLVVRNTLRRPEYRICHSGAQEYGSYLGMHQPLIPFKDV